MAKKVVRWQADDGTLHETERAAKKHEAKGQHECPKCQGLGRINGEPIHRKVLDKEAPAFGGFFAEPVYKKVIAGYVQVACDVCQGQGWTESKKMPITETKVVGWE